MYLRSANGLLLPEYPRHKPEPTCERNLDWDDPINRGLIGFYALDEINILRDISLANANGSGVSGLKLGPSHHGGQATQFTCTASSSTSSYGDLGAVYNFTSQDFSFSFWGMWFNFDTNLGAGSGVIPFYKGEYNQSGYYSSVGVGGFSLTTNAPTNNRTVASSSAIAAGLWAHYVVTRSGASIRLYVNGVDCVTTAGSHGTIASASNNFLLGRYLSFGSPYIYSMNGLMDLFRVFNRKLFPFEAERLCREPSAGFLDANPDSRSFWFIGASGASGNVNVSVTGVLLSSGIGALGLSLLDSASGVSAATAAGTIGPSGSGAVSGISISSSLGADTISGSDASSGVAIASGAGTLKSSESVSISGVGATFAAGVFTDQISLALSGIQIASGVGSLSGSDSDGIGGVAISASTGTIFFGSIAVSGVNAHSAIGSISPSVAAIISGVQMSASLGTIIVTTGGGGREFISRVTLIGNKSKFSLEGRVLQ